MVELYQFPWSPYCLVVQRMLEFGGIEHRLINVSAVDRTIVWKLTRQRYYQVPIIKHGRNVVFETSESSQVIAKYIDNEFDLGLFPLHWAGLQQILWAYIENEVESLTFRLNDAYYQEFVPRAEQLPYLRHKERKFGTGCISQWRRGSSHLTQNLKKMLLPFDQMLRGKWFLLDEQPRFVDFDLWGMLANFLYSGHYKLPSAYSRLRQWYDRLSTLRSSDLPREKLRP